MKLYKEYVSLLTIIAPEYMRNLYSTFDAEPFSPATTKRWYDEFECCRPSLKNVSFRLNFFKAIVGLYSLLLQQTAYVNYTHVLTMRLLHQSLLNAVIMSLIVVGLLSRMFFRY